LEDILFKDEQRLYEGNVNKSEYWVLTPSQRKDIFDKYAEILYKEFYEKYQNREHSKETRKDLNDIQEKLYFEDIKYSTYIWEKKEGRRYIDDKAEKLRRTTINNSEQTIQDMWFEWSNSLNNKEFESIYVSIKNSPNPIDSLDKIWEIPYGNWRHFKENNPTLYKEITTYYANLAIQKYLSIKDNPDITIEELRTICDCIIDGEEWEFIADKREIRQHIKKLQEQEERNRR
jgi:hypothetical protein